MACCPCLFEGRISDWSFIDRSITTWLEVFLSKNIPTQDETNCCGNPGHQPRNGCISPLFMRGRHGQYCCRVGSTDSRHRGSHGEKECLGTCTYLVNIRHCWSVNPPGNQLGLLECRTNWRCLNFSSLRPFLWSTSRFLRLTIVQGSPKLNRDPFSLGDGT